ncbi:MAG: Gfo/Idh/MocA family oxidoreductase [Verrucomicrobiales bacterium]
MSKLRIGVAGVGAIGQNHARVLSELPQAELTVIFDTDAARAAEIAERYGAQVATDLDTFASLVDAATVATPTVTHAEIGGYLIDAGKHVLIEKPITTTVEDARMLVERARLQKCILQVGHIERFNPVMAMLEEQLSNPRFIEVHRLSPFPQRSMDIGVVLDVMIHDLEILLHLVKAPLEKVEAAGVAVLAVLKNYAYLQLVFANGCVANVTASRVSPEKLRKIRVFQEDCYVSLDYQEQEGIIYRKEGLQIVPVAVQVEKDEPLKLELASFVDCAQRGERPKVSGQDGAAALDVALEITRLIEVGQAKS